MDEFRKLTAFSVALNVLMGVTLAGLSGLFPLLYATTDQVRQLATRFLLVQGTELIKCVLGFIMIKRGTWMQQIIV